MKLVILLAVTVLTSSAFAESKTLTLEGVHCQDCVATLQEKICGDKTFATCQVKLINEKKELGQLKLTTKGDAKIDMQKIAKIVEDEGYKIKK